MSSDNVKASVSEALAKVPEVTLGFWLIKILATTLGETGGDAVSMSMNRGYLVSTLIFAAFFAFAVCAQILRIDSVLAVLGHDHREYQGGLALSRYTASLVLPGGMAGLICLLPKRAARKPH